MTILYSAIMFFKSFFSFINDFLKTKIGQITLIILLSILFIFLVYNNGYNNGIDYQTNKYNLELKKQLDIQKDKMLLEKDEAIKLIKKDVIVEKVYIDKIKVVNKIIHDNPKLSSKECSLTNNELKDFNKALDEIK